MASLPAEYAIPTYQDTSISAGKIKFKIPAGSIPKTDPSAATGGSLASPGLTLKLPAPVTNTVPSNTVAHTPSRAVPETRVSTPSAPEYGQASSSTAGKPLLTTQPTIPGATPMGSRSVFPAKAASPAPNGTSMTQPAPQAVTQTQSYTPSPAPPDLPLKHPIRSAILKTTPAGRTFRLHREEGVRIWSVRLGVGERAIRLSQLNFVDDWEEVSDADMDGEPDETEEDEPGSNRIRRKGGPKGAGNKIKKEKGRDKENGVHNTPAPEPVVRLNGNGLKSTVGLQSKKEWQGDLQVGSNSLEFRAGDVGEVWKVFLERQMN